MHLFYSSGLESERVGIADLKVSNNPHHVLISGWLGAGLALAAFDPIASVAGLAHVPLPDSRSARDLARRRPALFLDTGLPALFLAMSQLGAQESRMVLCIAGGGRLWHRNAPPTSGPEMIPTALGILAQRTLQTQARHPSISDDCCCSLDAATGEVRLKLSGEAGVIVLWKNSIAS